MRVNSKEKKLDIGNEVQRRKKSMVAVGREFFDAKKEQWGFLYLVCACSHIHSIMGSIDRSFQQAAVSCAFHPPDPCQPAHLHSHHRCLYRFVLFLCAFKGVNAIHSIHPGNKNREVSAHEEK